MARRDDWALRYAKQGGWRDETGNEECFDATWKRPWQDGPRRFGARPSPRPVASQGTQLDPAAHLANMRAKVAAYEAMDYLTAADRGQLEFYRELVDKLAAEIGG